MEKLALGLTLITIVITIFFLAIMSAFGIIETNDLKHLKNIVVQSKEKRFRRDDGK